MTKEALKVRELNLNTLESYPPRHFAANLVDQSNDAAGFHQALVASRS